MNNLEIQRANQLWVLLCKCVAQHHQIELPADEVEAITQLTMSHGPQVLALHQRVMPRLEAQPSDPVVIERMVPEVISTARLELQQEQG